jgi:sigma-B regulation protein RsbU (phosphoserine phosphatase)
MEETRIPASPAALEKVQLHWLLQITKAINYNLPARQLFEIYRGVLHDHLKIGKLLVFVHDQSWQQILSYGVDFRKVEVVPERDLPRLVDFAPGGAHLPPWLGEFETIVPVIHNGKPVGYAFLGACGLPPESQKKVLPFIHTITNIIVVAIENKRLTHESMLRVAMQKELQLAAEVQRRLFPERLDGFGVFDVAATYLPHQEVGGDYYDLFRLGADESMVCMADVSGKGMAAALLMAGFQAGLRALAPSTASLPALVAALNEAICRNARGERFITVFLARIDHRRRTLRYVNAGHNPPFLVRAGRAVPLEKGTTVLGTFDELPFLQEGEAALAKGDALVCYTDGIPDLEDPRGRFFGIDAFLQLVGTLSADASMEAFNKAVRDRLNAFRGEAGFNDDVTLLSLRLL